MYIFLFKYYVLVKCSCLMFPISIIGGGNVFSTGGRGMYPYRILKMVKLKVNIKVVQFYRSIRQIEGLVKTKYPINLILIISILQDQRSTDTPELTQFSLSFLAKKSGMIICFPLFKDSVYNEEPMC